jgi:hypothetical protein
MRTAKRARAQRCGLMVRSTRESTKMARKTEGAFSSGLMAVSTMESSWTTTSKGKVNTAGQMGEYTKEHG